MFLICSKITIGTLQPFVCTEATWERGIDNYADTATVVVPAIYFLQKRGNDYNPKVIGSYVFKEGDPITIEAGYNGNYVKRFQGFIKRLNYSSPLKIECEGYSYKLQTVYINKTYTNSSVKKILADITSGTGITLSPNIPDVFVEQEVFSNKTAIQVLEILKKHYLLTIYFNFNEIYAGLRATQPKGSVNFHIGWNTVNADDLMFSGYKEFSTVRIQVAYRKSNGDISLLETDGNGDTKTIHLPVPISDEWQKQVVNDAKLVYTNMGYTGNLLAFLEPYVDIGMSANISDYQYPERSGTYFVEKVKGSLSRRGGRQSVGIGYQLD